MSSINLKLYNILKNDLNLSEDKAQAFAEAIKEEVINDIRSESSEFKSLFKDDFNRLELKIEQSKSETLKWVLGIFITLVIMIFGLYATILLK